MSHPVDAQPQPDPDMHPYTRLSDTTANAQKTSNTRRDSARGSQSAVPSGAAQRPSEPSVAEEDASFVPVQTVQPASGQVAPHFRPPQWSHGTHEPLATSQVVQQSLSKQRNNIPDALAAALQLPIRSIPEAAQPVSTEPSSVSALQNTQDRREREVQPLLPDAEPEARATPSGPLVASMQPQRLPPLSIRLSNQMSGRFQRSGPYKIPSMSVRSRVEWTCLHEEQWLSREPVFQHLVVPMAFMNDVITFVRDLGGDFRRRAALLEVICHME
ncbi:uncharacterized protein EKO05_0011079 [Ascochyta rabiei]|uniref:uncharacterized protein n=1 Tax=Didymella rabiei TaxID=5454 RepID=UPI0022044FF8|nr:uncharacterized protein EKO05_0011079 [Ascochyta rabiei]UPX20864.1 hypothetical protein EKO05_0011079 [Ascochyta rabiei]